MNLDTNSLRSRKARAASHIGNKLWRSIKVILLVIGLCSVALMFSETTRPFGFIWLGIAVQTGVVALWYRLDLSRLPTKPGSKNLEDIIESKLLAQLSRLKTITPKSAWESSLTTWQGKFFDSRLLLPNADLQAMLSDDTKTMDAVWQKAIEIGGSTNSNDIDGSALAAALIITLPDAKKTLASYNLTPDEVIDVVVWCRRLASFMSEPRPRFGGIGRDWAAGFTPMLDKFGTNISREIELGSGHFHTLAHSDVLDGAVHSLSQGTGAVALVGEAGSGKTGLAYALAQRLLSGEDKSLRYFQMFSLDATAIMSASKEELEKIMLSLFAEAVHAGNIILFLDEGQLFFNDGTGSFDMSKILLPVLQNKSVKIVAAFTPHDFQKIKNSNESLITNFGVINISEPDKQLTMRILEDTALTLEAKNSVMVSYRALKEAYKLSGQYNQDIAYPGRAISLLEQSLPYVKDKILDDTSVQEAIERTKGVKVSKAGAAETDVLLHLEDKIHERMINQVEAVKVVASALRRGRAGVSSPKRPTGSFLFLGPTGVGKTELAKSLAATYFGDEEQMIRLDMSEYQQASDVSRLLDPGGDVSKSLILSIREQPFSVVLLDEIEKAHPNILNLLLQLLDEGQISDSGGKVASFRNAIIICTSNAGANDIIAKIDSGDSLADFERPLLDKLIAAGQFKPELINRFDEVVLFRPLNQQELTQVAELMIAGVNKTLSEQNITVKLTPAALTEIVKKGYDAEFGARPMRRVVQKTVENNVANKILEGKAESGTEIILDVADLSE